MGAAISSASISTTKEKDIGKKIFANQNEREAVEHLLGTMPRPSPEDPTYHILLTQVSRLTQLSSSQVAYFHQRYGPTLTSNNLLSGNFAVIVQIVIQALTRISQADISSTSFNAMELYAVNSLFLLRQLSSRFIEKNDEFPFYSHFQPLPVLNSTLSNNGNSTTENLAPTLLETLLKALVKIPRGNSTYDLHVEIVNTLLVLLSPVIYPQTHRTQNEMSNPFLLLLMQNRSSSSASSIVQCLLQNVCEQCTGDSQSFITESQLAARYVALQSSLLRQAKQKQRKDEEKRLQDEYERERQLSLLSLEGLGSLAYYSASFFLSIPMNVLRTLLLKSSHEDDPSSAPEKVSTLADRSTLLLLVLLQSFRDLNELTAQNPNPYRLALEKLQDSNEEDTNVDYSIDFTQLVCVMGNKAAFETYHLLMYSLMYTNERFYEKVLESGKTGPEGSPVTCKSLLLPYLEILHASKSLTPRRLYVLVIVVLTFTQDQSFVLTSHTSTTSMLSSKHIPWFQNRLLLEISIGSFLIIIFTQLIHRNITHFQDSFLHVNAFAGLSNLTTTGGNLHTFAAQSIIGLIALLAKNERKLQDRLQQARLENLDAAAMDVLQQKQTAYVEFIRLLLGIVSSCLKDDVLPRNPHLIYCLLHQAELLESLHVRPEFSSQVNNNPVWSTLAKFQNIVHRKMLENDGYENHDGSMTDEAQALPLEELQQIIEKECVALLASRAARINRPTTRKSSFSNSGEDDTSYRYEEGEEPEQFFIPYVWRLLVENTPDLHWRYDKIALFSTNAEDF